MRTFQRDQEGTDSPTAGTLAARRGLLQAARRKLWWLIRERTERAASRLVRSTLRRRVTAYLRRLSRARLVGILRSATLAGAVATALLSGVPAAAQEFPLPPIDLADVARGEGGLVVRGEGEPASGTSLLVPAGDVNGDGFEDLIAGGCAWRRYGCPTGPTHVIFGTGDGAPVELSEVHAGRGGFAILSSERLQEFFGTGILLAGAGDVNGDGLADVVIGFPGAGEEIFDDDGDPIEHYRAGESYVVFGKADGAPVELSDVKRGLGGFMIRGVGTNARSGASVAHAGDVDGDGLADVIVGAPGYGVYSGAAYVVFGKTDGAVVELRDVQEESRGGFAIHGNAEREFGASSVSGAGDVNGDGLADVIVGAPDAYAIAGESYVVFGKADGAEVYVSDIREGQGGFAIRGSTEEDRSGSSVAGAGDLDGDGLADLLVGAPGASPGGRQSAGESYVVFGKADGEVVQLELVAAGERGFAIRGVSAFDVAGSSVAGARDVNGDGVDDLLIRASGASYVVFGKSDGAAVDLGVVNSGGAGFAMTGYGISSVAGGADLNGDGFADILIGSAGDGVGYVVFGKPGGEAVELGDVPAGEGGFVIRGRPTRDLSGSSLADVGDVNGDGLSDLLVGARLVGQFVDGESYVVFGRSDGLSVELSEVEEGRGGFAIRARREPGKVFYTGFAVAGAGDVNGDGLADLLIGARVVNPNEEGPDVSYLVFGKPDGAPVELSEVEEGRGGFMIYENGAGGRVGNALAGARDVNGDGLADFLIGTQAARQDPGSSSASYVVFGKTDGSPVELFEVDGGEGGFVIRGAPESGSSVAGAGDVNGDGLADLIIGSPAEAPEGRAQAGVSYVVFGKADSSVVELWEVEVGNGGFPIHGRAQEDRSGSSVSGAGDVNGDGLADLVVGAPGADPVGRAGAGVSYVVFGKSDGTAVELREVEAGDGGFAMRGVAERDCSGSNVAAAGDLNGDGLADVLIDALDFGGEDLAGSSYAVFGKADGNAVELSKIESGQGGLAIRWTATKSWWLGSSVGAGDFNGDGLADIANLSGLADTRYPSISSVVYVVFGQPRWHGVAPQFRRGAVRGEERLDISDGIALLDYLFLGGDEPPCLDAADADDSGTLELTDAVRILGYLFLGALPPSAPGPASCGGDPTPDELGCVGPSGDC